MREKREPDFRRRSPPPQPKYRSFSGPVRSEPERSRPVGSDEEGQQFRKLTEFNETLARNESSASIKFQWDHLLAEKPAKQKSTENDSRSTLSYSTAVSSCKNYGLISSSSRYDLLGPLQRNEPLMADVEDDDDYRLRPNAGRKSVVDSIVDKIYGNDSSSSMQRTILDCDGRSLQWGGSGLGSGENVYETTEGSSSSSTHQQMFEDSLQNMLKRKLMVDLKMNIGENPVSNLLPHDPGYGDEQYWSNQDVQQQLPLSKSPGYEHSPVGRAGWVFDEMGSQRIADSDDWLPSPDLSASMQQQLSSEPIKTSGRNIKERLGPASRDIINKRLGPAQKTHKSNPWVKNSLRNQSLRKNLNDIHEPLHVQRRDSSKVKAKRAKNETHVRGSESLKVKAKSSKTEPPEDSEEFNKLVHINFFKFVKALNENSALRRRYTEQRGAATLKCSICGSNSKEFMDTLSLVQHAFTSRMVGARAEHLGFHKALCVLMGWNSTAALNSPWVRQILPDGEALVLKEDLIIWPPVVFVHNSSIANYNPDERIIVSTEELSAILRGMGFGRGMAKVYHGRPANQSIMVVSFQGTYSGLEEAERLHEFYAKNKYGRAEFKQIDFSSSNSSSGGTQIVPAEKVGNILYGYLGIADDLDKLDFGTKRHSVVKSKTEIQAIADAPLNSK